MSISDMTVSMATSCDRLTRNDMAKMGASSEVTVMAIPSSAQHGQNTSCQDGNVWVGLIFTL